MAEIPNRSYPARASHRYIADTFQGNVTGSVITGSTRVYGEALSGSTLQVNAISGSTITGSKIGLIGGTQSGSTIVAKGCICLSGFTATGAISLYQPVIASAHGKVVGATTRITEKYVLGLAASAAADGGNVEIIVHGVVPYLLSGAIMGDTRPNKFVVFAGPSGSGTLKNAQGVITGAIDNTGSALGYAITSGSEGAMFLLYVHPYNG